MIRFTLALLLLVSFTLSYAESRGIRNNNPGNIIATPITWLGEVQCEDLRFTCFSTPSYGIRAMMKILMTYQSKHELHTLAQLMNRWAPPNENDTNSIDKFMSRNLRISNHLPYDLTIRDNVVRLVDTIIKLENGYQPYTLTYLGDIYDTIRNNHRGYKRTSGRIAEDMGYEFQGQGRTEYTVTECSKITGRSISRGTQHQGRRIYLDPKDYCNHYGSLCLRVTKDRSIVWYRCHGGVLRMVSRLPIF